MTQLEAIKSTLEYQVNTLNKENTDLKSNVQDLNNTSLTNLVFWGVGGIVIDAIVILLLIRARHYILQLALMYKWCQDGSHRLLQKYLSKVKLL